MEVLITRKELIKLYETGHSNKYKLPENVTDKYVATILKIQAAKDIYDLWKDKSLNFEKLKGTTNNYSIRLTIQWRLEMEIEWEDNNKTIGIITITEISKHYQ